MYRYNIIKIVIVPIILGLFFVGLLAIAPASASANESNQVTVDLDGKRMEFPDALPILDGQNRTLVPIRFISESLGYEVDWSQQTWHSGRQLIWISNLANSMQLEIGNNEALVNSQQIELDTSAVLLAGRTYVPLRFIIENFGAEVEWQKTSYGINVTITRPSLEIVEVEYKEDVYYQGQTISAQVALQNNQKNDDIVWLGYSLRDPHGEWIDIPAQKLTVASNSTHSTKIDYVIEADILSGEYDVVFAIWDNVPGAPDAERISDVYLTKKIKIYRAKDDFIDFDNSFWQITSGRTLGRSLFQKENVTVENGKLLMTLPARTLAGAEIQSKELFSYGSYEIRMKLPDARCSITGFFLYKMPDFYHEIDIEVFNQKNGPVHFTTYADGAMNNTIGYELDYDLTKNYHNYRFDYYQDRVDFYVDDVLLQTWIDGFTTEPMFLMLNVWYPNWLEGTRLTHEQRLSVDWIRY